MSVASVILEQLGGNKFRAMTGAKNFVDCGNALMFMLPNRKINKVIVRLMPSDTYEMEFWKIRGTKTKLVYKTEDVYNSDLQDVFKDQTGLDTHL